MKGARPEEADSQTAIAMVQVADAGAAFFSELAVSVQALGSYHALMSPAPTDPDPDLDLRGGGLARESQYLFCRCASQEVEVLIGCTLFEMCLHLLLWWLLAARPF
ncbi:UNVERIFIED_CONTAM: hypothetical protein K2H54_011021 [Gekko kuhli]